MSSKGLFLTCDIGSCSLKMAEFSLERGKLSLVGFAYTQYAAGKKEEDKYSQLQNTISSVIGKNNFRSKKLFLSVSNQFLFTRFVTLPAAIRTKKQKIAQLVNFEAKQSIPYPLEEVTWDYQIVDKYGNNDELTIMLSVIKTDTITSLVAIFEKLGFEILLVGTTPTALYNYVHAAKLDKEGVSVVINIGGRSTSIVIIDDFFPPPRVIPLGGHTITSQISKELKISFDKAEELKKREGALYQESNQNLLHKAQERAKGRIEERVALSRIIRDVMTRIQGEITKSIDTYNSQKHLKSLSKIYLSGGGSMIKDTDFFLNEKLNLNVEYLNTFNLLSIPGQIDKKELTGLSHMFPKLLGLAVNCICSLDI